MTASFRVLSSRRLSTFSQQRGLSLSGEEMAAIQGHFKKEGRDPTFAEMETLAQTWSEHCKHKTFRAHVTHREVDPQGVEHLRIYDDLLKDTIVRATRAVRRKWCVSVFKDNAGIVTYDGKKGWALKVETHNHPSALEPYGGAGTGLGGVIRDVLGAGLGAKPVANTDVFCFGPLDDKQDMPTGSGLSMRRIVEGVVAGVRDYGNRMGIPTVSGAVVFDEDFRDNPLVFCGTLGYLPLDKVPKSVRRGDRIVMLGGRVGRDGIHGATFSSDSLRAGLPASVVQIGNPIVEKKVLDVLLVARDRGLYRGITDCGAGGLSSAVGEMGEKTGARVHLDRVPLKYQGIKGWEIWISESQERMVLAVPPKHLKALLHLCASEDVEATDIGEFAGAGRLKVSHGAKVLVDLSMEFLHQGVPHRQLKSYWRSPAVVEFPSGGTSPRATLLRVLSDPTIASKEWVIRQYDHEVQGRTVIKPLAGPKGRGPQDAVVLQEDPRHPRGVALSCGLWPHASRWDPYGMAAGSVDEAVRNLISVGARPDRIALLDNFCGGNPSDPQVLGELVRAAQACHDVAVAYGTPFISGKDSLYNEFVDPRTQHRRSIPTTLLITALSTLDDASQAVTMDLKKPGHWLFALGWSDEELGGSALSRLRGTRGGRLPALHPRETWPLYLALHQAMKRGWVSSCHDVSEGGWAAALGECALAGGLGLKADLRKVPLRRPLSLEALFFGESQGRFVIEVPPIHRRALQKHFSAQPLSCIGQVTERPVMELTGPDGHTSAWSVDALAKAFQGSRP